MGRDLQLAFPLLDGEAESGAADAAHWSDVYDQLVNFCHTVLAEHDALDSVDRDGLRRRLRHFEQRRDYRLQEGRSA